MSHIAILATATTSWPTAAPAVGTAYRVSGDSAPATLSGGLWKSGNLALEAPIPDGYVPPTPENCVEIKSYPSVRRAEFDSSNLWWPDFMGMGQNRAFSPLFKHISSRNIPMTSPVEMNYHNLASTVGFLQSANPSDWTMSFLYKTSTLGPVGPAENDINVVDTAPVTVISVALTGSYGLSVVQTGIA